MEAGSPLMGELAGLLSVLGISIDSADALRNQQIGREDRHRHRLEPTALTRVIALGRQLNPALRLKINTVVNALNHREDMAPLLPREELAKDMLIPLVS